MTTRLHENPISLMRFATLTESAANTYTERQQLTPTQAVGRAKLIAIEVGLIMLEIGAPSIEAGEANSASAHLSTESKSALGRMGSDPDIILHNVFSRTAVTTTSVGELWVDQLKQTVFYNLLLDGKGKIIVSRDIFLAIVGVGNAAARFANAVLFGWLVEVSQDDLVALAVADDF